MFDNAILLWWRSGNGASFPFLFKLDCAVWYSIMNFLIFHKQFIFLKRCFFKLIVQYHFKTSTLLRSNNIVKYYQFPYLFLQTTHKWSGNTFLCSTVIKEEITKQNETMKKDVFKKLKM